MRDPIILKSSSNPGEDYEARLKTSTINTTKSIDEQTAQS
jgi:hypothetical protein